MVVGPEYAAIISVALASPSTITEGSEPASAALFFGFLIAYDRYVRLQRGRTCLRPGIRRPSVLASGQVEPDQHARPPSPSWSPRWPELLAWCPSVEARTGELIGVFIYCTTIPAAADIGVSIAFQNWSEGLGLLVQLLLNVAILVTVGAVGLVAQQRAWNRLASRGRSEPSPGRVESRSSRVRAAVARECLNTTFQL